MRKSWIGFAAIAAMVVSPALAADMALKAPPPAAAPVYSWTGCYIGGNFGLGWADKENIDDITVPPQSLGSHTASGFVGGGQLGCDYQVSSWVFGIRGLFDGAADMTGQNTIPQNAAVAYTTDIPWFGMVTGRIGYTITPSLLAYGQAGGAWVKDNHQKLFPQPTVSASGSDVFDGWTAGGGFEYMFNPNLSVFVEYDYFGLSDVHTCFVPLSCGAGGVGGITQKLNVQTVLVGVNLRFNPFGAR